MEPEFGFLAAGHRIIPGVDGVGFAFHQPPIDRPDFIFLEDRQTTLEGALVLAGHVFGANDRTFVGFL